MGESASTLQWPAWPMQQSGRARAEPSEMRSWRSPDRAFGPLRPSKDRDPHPPATEVQHRPIPIAFQIRCEARDTLLATAGRISASARLPAIAKEYQG